jgi:hypothetical protein
MTLNLRKDAPAIHALFAKAVNAYARKHKANLAKFPPGSRIDLTFFLTDGGRAAPFLQLHLDTRPDAEPNGTSTHREFTTLKFPAWRAPPLAAAPPPEPSPSGYKKNTHPQTLKT